ncbi:MAG: transposase [Glaciecola sp.]
MTIARKHLINYSQTCYYHCMSRCIDQRFLLRSSTSQQRVSNYRKAWIQKRLLFLAEIFAIDLLSFAIMDNHTHSVLHVNHALVNSWSNTEVLNRISQLGKLPLLCKIYQHPEWRTQMKENELADVLKLIDDYRQKLTSISWFMSKLNSYIAKRANKEDGRKGHFWEGRYKSQALLDAEAVLACMAYVDLNPFRARVSECIFSAKHTSIRIRMKLCAIKCAATLLPIGRTTTMFAPRYLINYSLHEYVRHLEIKAGCSKSTSFDNFVDSQDNWVKTEYDFNLKTAVAAGPPELVESFTKRVRASSKRINKLLV